MNPVDLLIVGGRVYPCDDDHLRHIDAGVVAIHGDTITYVGPAEGAPTQAACVVDAAGRAVLPGLVDPHTHLVFGGSRVDEFARRMAGEDYRTIAAEGGGIAHTVGCTRDASESELFELATARASRMRSLGVTSVEIKSGYGLRLEDELRTLRVAGRLEEMGIVRTSPTFLGAHSVPPEFAEDRAGYITEVIDRMLPAVVEAQLAECCDVYCDDGAFDLSEARTVLQSAQAAGLQVRGHVGQFKDLGGAELLGAMGALSADHLEAVSDAGLDALAAGDVVGVLLPGAWRTLRQVPPEAERFRRAGVNMAVGTDLNPGTSPCVDLPLAAALAVRDAGMHPHEAILGITRYAAQAAGLPRAGTLRAGQLADVAIFPFTDARTLVYALGSPPAWQVYLGGQLVHHAPDSAQGIW